MIRTGALLLLVFTATAPDEGGTRHLRYQRPVLLDGGSTGQTCIALPPDVFPHAAQGLQDLRLFQGEREVPYALRVATSPPAVPVVRQVNNLGTVNGNTTFEADPPTGSYNEVTLEITAHDFIAAVTVTGMPDGKGVAPVTLGTFTVFDLTGQKLGRSMVLHLPQSTFPHLRFQIKGRLKPEDVSGVTFQSEAIGGSEAAYVTAATGGPMRQDSRRSVLIITVPPHVPVDRIAFVPSGDAPPAFSRDVTVTEKVPRIDPPQEDEEPYALHFPGNLQRVHRQQEGRRVDVENLTLDAPGAPADTAATWQISVDNGDDAPLPFQGVELQMRQRDICFDDGGGAPYTLYYGDSSRKRPAYDYERLFSPAEHPARASLGPEQENAGYEPVADSRPFTERHPALLWVGLLLTIAVLGFVALRSTQAAPGTPE